MAKTYTFSECYELLQADPKTFRRWLEKADINPDDQVSKADNRIRFLTEEQLQQLAHDHGRSLQSAPTRTVESVSPAAYKLLAEQLAERLDNAERDIQLLQDDLKNAWLITGTCQRSIINLEEQLQQVQETITRLQRPQERTRKVRDAAESAEGLPEGLITWRSFADLHHVSQTTTASHIANGFIKVIRGKWKMGRVYVKEALDTQGRRDFWVQFHSSSSFLTCDDCPHEPPETV
jgi:predicted RNase H-like nuclease (RuvC/YqgF family)